MNYVANNVSVKTTIGRLMLMTDETEITRQNIEQVVTKAFYEHQENVRRETFLFEYEKGLQPLVREKKIRSEINAQLIVNEASRIVDTHVGYRFANPVTLVERAETEEGQPKEDNQAIASLNKMFYEQSKGTKDLEMARNLYICGLGYMGILPARKKYQDRYAPFELFVPCPLTTFVVYSNDAFREPMVACTYSEKEDGSITLTAYSDEWMYELSRDSKSNDYRLTGKIVKNVIGIIPIVEFALNDRMGVFEKVIPILDYLNVVDSDRINDIMQHVQSLLWLHNCALDTEGKKNLVDGDGVIMTKTAGEGHDAKITYLNQTLNETEIQTLVNHLLEEIEKITSTPSWKEASGGSTTGAMQLSNGWQCLEICAKADEQMFNEKELMLIDMALKLIKADHRPYSEMKDLKMSDIEIRFSRTKNYDLISKTNALVSLLNAGVDGQTAFKTVELFTDANQAWVDSSRIITGMQERLVANDTPTNIIENANAAVDERGQGGANNTEKDVIEQSNQPSRVSGVME